MKNKKGFTLTELLIVMVLLVLVAGTTIFGMDEISKKADERRLEELINEIELATDVYFTNNDVYTESLLNGETDIKCTRLYILQKEGLIDLELINPITKERIPANLCVYSSVNESGVIEHKFELEQ